MILFLTQFQDDLLQKFTVNFAEKYGITTIYKTMKDFLDKDKICVSCEENNFSSKINSFNFDEIKLCFLNYDAVFYKELFSFKDDYDNEYASQEWNAAFLALCESSKNTKFVNKLLRKYNCDTEIEHILLYQKFGLDTINMFLTNNVNDFLTIKDMCENSVIIKNLIRGYDKSKMFSAEDCKKLDKLYLSPYIFQKAQNGNNAIITNIGDEFLTFVEGFGSDIDIPIGLKEKLTKLKEELGMNAITYYAVYSNENFYFYSLSQTFSFSEFANIFGEQFEQALTNFIIKEYKN